MPETQTTAKKLQLKPGYVVRLIGATGELVALVEPLPTGAIVSVDASELPDACVMFVRDAADLRERFATELDGLRAAASVWVAYRKGNVIDMNRNTIITESERVGWQPVSNVSLGDEWSAVRIRTND